MGISYLQIWRLSVRFRVGRECFGDVCGLDFSVSSSVRPSLFSSQVGLQRLLQTRGRNNEGCCVVVVSDVVFVCRCWSQANGGAVYDLPFSSDS